MFSHHHRYATTNIVQSNMHKKKMGVMSPQKEILGKVFLTGKKDQ